MWVVRSFLTLFPTHSNLTLTNRPFVRLMTLYIIIALACTWRSSVLLRSLEHGNSLLFLPILFSLGVIEAPAPMVMANYLCYRSSIYTQISLPCLPPDFFRVRDTPGPVNR